MAAKKYTEATCSAGKLITRDQRQKGPIGTGEQEERRGTHQSRLELR